MNIIHVDIEAYFKDHYWNGWWWDRSCLYTHSSYDNECVNCKGGNWYYTPPSKTGMKRFGERMEEPAKHELGKGRIYMDRIRLNKGK